MSIRFMTNQSLPTSSTHTRIGLIHQIYRRLIRIAIRMPDHHRIRFVGFCARREVNELIKHLDDQPKSFENKLHQLHIYADQLDHQAQSLSELSRTPHQLMIPIELRIHSPTLLQPRRVLWAVTPHQTLKSDEPNRFMNGPQPSWLKSS